MDIKSQNLEFKAIQEGKNLYVSGYAATFNVVDSYGDIILPNAFTKTLQGLNGKRIKLCLQHDMDDVIGKIQEIYEDNIGLYFKAKISNTTKGGDLATLIIDEAINEISIGYLPEVFEIDSASGVRYLKEISLFEISFVSRAANAQAIVTGQEVKNLQTDKDQKSCGDKPKDEKVCDDRRKPWEMSDAELMEHLTDLKESSTLATNEYFKRLINNL